MTRRWVKKVVNYIILKKHIKALFVAFIHAFPGKDRCVTLKREAYNYTFTETRMLDDSRGENVSQRGTAFVWCDGRIVVC